MRAAVYHEYGPPSVVSVTDLPTPTPTDDDVLIRVRAAAVSAADAALRAADPFIARVAAGLFRPKIATMGSEFAGEVAAVGAAVTRFQVGDRIWGATGDDFGAHAEYLLVKQDAAIALMPTNLAFAEAVAVSEGALTALPFLQDTAELKAGQSILINGASGGVGSSAVQLAKHLGAQVTGVCSTANVELVRSLGADEVVDYTVTDFTNVSERYDVIFDAVGKSSYRRCKAALKPDGLYMTTVPSAAIAVQTVRSTLFGRRKAAIALTGLHKAPAKIAVLDEAKHLAEAGVVIPVLDSVYPLHDVVAAHARVDTGHKVGAVVLTMGEEEAA